MSNGFKILNSYNTSQKGNAHFLSHVSTLNWYFFCFVLVLLCFVLLCFGFASPPNTITGKGQGT